MDDEMAIDAAPRGITVNERLERIADGLRNGQKPEPVIVRELLSWFGAQRRGSFNCFYIRSALDEAGLTTDPDFVLPYIDNQIEFHLKDSASPRPSEESSLDADVLVFPGGEAKSDEKITSSPASAVDPTYRIGRLRWANVIPTSVSPNHSVTEAITIMLANDFSQLPVMVGEREVKGVISWSSIGTRLALGIKCTEVRECMDGPHIISSDTRYLTQLQKL
jgi:hypothetical protein